MFDPELPFTIESWAERDNVEQKFAQFSDLLLARQCFELACARFPNKRLTLRKATRVIMKNYEN